MTRFADELCGSEGEWCQVHGERAIIRAVHDGGQKVTVQFERDERTELVWHDHVELEGNEDKAQGRPFPMPCSDCGAASGQPCIEGCPTQDDVRI
jgi:hypothetical protein